MAATASNRQIRKAVNAQAHDLANAPICPRCQAHVMYLTPSWESRPDQQEPVECGCGWTGFHIRMRSSRG